MSYRDIIVGTTQILFCLAAVFTVRWLLAFIESPSLGGFTLFIGGTIVVFVGCIFCAIVGGVDIGIEQKKA